MIRALLVLHAVTAFAALAAVTHHAAHAVLAALGRTEERALRRFGVLAPALMLAQAALGLLLYPAYRIEVRAADFDLHAPFVAALFDLKEHLAALSLPLVVAAALAGRRPQEGSARVTVAALSCSGAALVWAAAVLGLYVAGRHPVGMR